MRILATDKTVHRGLRRAVLGCALAVTLASSGSAGVVVYDQDGKKIEIGGRLQLLYTLVDPDEGASSDRIVFRRLRPYVSGTVTEDWYGKIELDLGEAEDEEEVAIKDAYVQYLGWENLKLTIGNAKTPYSREFLTSSARQQLVERTFVGDHNFGAPDRQLGLKLEGANTSEKIEFALAAGAQHFDPDAERLDFDTPVNNRSDWNEGFLVAGRVDFHPRGPVSFAQGDFDRGGFKYTVSVAAFTWDNDGDNNTYTAAGGTSLSTSRADLDSAEGFELSAALRGGGVSIDAEYNLISGDTVAAGFTGGLYRDGTTDLDVLALEGGYMFPKSRFELVGGWESLDASNYEEAWERTSLGVNYFWNEHNLKLQLTLRLEESVFGRRGNDQNLTFVNFQYVF